MHAYTRYRIVQAKPIFCRFVLVTLRNLGFPFLPSLRFLFFPDFGRKEIRGYVLSFSSKREAEGELIPLETFVSEDREEIWLFFRLEEDRKFEDEE